MHRVSQESFQRSSLAGRVVLETRQHLGELWVLLALGQNLQAEMVAADVFLVNVQHGQKDVEEIACHDVNDLVADQAKAKDGHSFTEDQSGPTIHASLEPFVEDLVQEKDGLAVEENGTDVFVSAGRFLGAGGHLERTVESRHQDLQLRYVLLFVFEHTKHQTVWFNESENKNSVQLTNRSRGGTTPSRPTLSVQQIICNS